MQQIGAKLKDLRVANGLTQEDIANRAKLTKGFISQLERDLTVPGVDTLFAILEALDTTPKEFFSESRQSKVHYPKSDRVREDWGEGVQAFEYLIRSTESKRMEPALLTLLPGQSLTKDAHKGEEFGFVLSGVLHLQIGKRAYVVKKGDAFYCDGNVAHALQNKGRSTLQFMWITTPPAF